MLPHLIMRAHHDVRAAEVVTRRLPGTLAAAAVISPSCCWYRGGSGTVESLAVVAEVMHGAPCRFSDPARFSLAHGGKDRHPYAGPIRVYDETIGILKSAVQKAALGRDEEHAALRRLDDQARQLEMLASGPSIDAHIARERAPSSSYDGRSVFGWEADLELAPKGDAALKEMDCRKCLCRGSTFST